MSSSRRFSFITFGMFTAGIATAVVAAAVSVWAWTTDEEVDPFFGLLFPVLTGWMVVALLRLAAALRSKADDGEDWSDPLRALQAAPRQVPDAAIRRTWPDATFYQTILLPPDPQSSWWLRRWRRRRAVRIELPQGHRLVVARASVIARRMAGIPS